MSDRVGKKRKMDYIFIYAFLLFSSGFYFHEHITAYLIPFLLTLIVVVLFIAQKKELIIQKNAFVIVFLLVFNHVFSSLVSGDNLLSIYLGIVAIITAALVVVLYSKREFLDFFCRVLYILCLGSIICFVLAILASGIIRLFPALYDSHGIAGYFTGVSFIQLKTKWVATRNASIFWEPGVFQTFILLAFAYEISKYGMKRTRYALVYMLAAITTMSSTAFIGLGIMLIIWLVEVNSQRNFKFFRIAISLLIVTTLGIIVFSWIPQGYSNLTLDKLQDLINGDSSNISVSSRVDSIIYPLKSFFASPVWGVGANGLAEWTDVVGHSMRTCTPINWFARYGLLFGLISNVGFMNVLDSLYMVKTNRILVCILFLLIISSEAYTLNSAILVFVFYGIVRKEDEDIFDYYENEV